MRALSWMKAILTVIFGFCALLFSAHAVAQVAPLCDTTCAPNPTSSTYGGALAARAKRQNARGASNPVTVVMASTAVSNSAGGPNPTVVGSQSYNATIPILTLPGRAGTNLSLNLHYNSRIWDVDTVGGTVTFNADRDFPSYGFRLDFGFIEYDSFNDVYLLTEPDDTKRSLTNIGSGYQSTDGSFILYTPGNGTLSYNNGTTIHYVVFPSQASGTQTLFRPVQLKDANGNFMSIAYVSGHDQFISTITDTVGRVIHFNYNTMTDGSLRLASISQDTTNPVGTKTYVTFSWGTVTFNYNFSGLTVNNSPASGSTINVLTGCTYANGTGYSFVYGDWGIIEEADQLSSNGAIRSFIRYDYPLASAGALTDAPTYSHQTLSPDGTTNNTSIFTYAVTKDSTGAVTSMTVTDPVGNYTVSNVDPNTGFLGSTQTFDNANNLLRETDLTWTTTGAGAGVSNVVGSTTTILKDTGQQSRSTYAYDPYGNVTDVYEYDFDGTLKRHTVTQYNAAQAYLSAHVLNLPVQIVVKDGVGNILARTDFAQDSTTLALVTGAPGHDDANYGSAFTTRGNLTSTTRYSNASAPSGGVTRTFSYDTLGNLVIAQMDCCNQKTIKFSSATGFSQPDSVTRGPNGGTQFGTSYTYNPDSGLLLSNTDENGQVTSYAYDSMGRQTQVILSSQVQLNTAYDDVDVVPTVTNSSTANNEVIVASFDGLGHVMQVDNKNCPVGQPSCSTIVSSVKYSYDKLWQRIQGSNPYGPSDIIVNTTFSYDGLGRITQVAPPSAGSTTYSYSGNTVTVTDPAGKQRKKYTDALGRLIEVDEPGETFAGTQAGGSTGVSGTLQSKVVGASNPTNATGSVTINGAEQCSSPPPPPPGCTPPMPCCIGLFHDPWQDGNLNSLAVAAFLQQTCDFGTVTITVNGHNDSYSFGSADTTTTIASHLAQNINADGAAYVTASASGATVYLTARTAGPNYSLASSYTYDAADFGSPSFTTSNSGSTLTGGSTGSSGTTVYDAGTVSITVGAFSSGSPTITGAEKSKLVSTRFCAEWTRNGTCADWEVETDTIYDSGIVSITVNGHKDNTTYSQGSTVSSVATGLAQAINADSAAFVNATAGTNGSITLTARQAGTAGNLSWSISTSSDDPTDFGSAGSFSASPISGTLAGGSANVFSASASYAQTGNSTPTQIASALASALSASGSPVTAVASGANINITYKSVGVIGNVPASCSSSTSQGTYFSSPSFTCSSITLAGGADSYSTGLGHPYATKYTYDAVDQLTAVSQAAGNVNGQPVVGQTRSYIYDNLGRQLTATAPESGTITIYYTDSNNNACAGDPSLPCRIQDARGVIKTFTYDSINRPATVTYSDGTPSVTYQYDAGGAAAFALNRLTKRIEGTGTTPNAVTFTYDNLGRITSAKQVIDSTTYLTQYTYNLASQLGSVIYPSGRVVTQSYDALGRTASISDSSATYLSGLSYNAAYQTLALTLGNGVQGTFTYNDHLQLSTLRYFKGSNDFLNLAYDYTTGVLGDNGQIQVMHYYSAPGMEDLTRTENFTYDAWGRLSAAHTGTVSATSGSKTWSLQWSYDRLGNRTSQTLVGGDPTLSIGQPQFTVDANTNRVVGYCYDAAGNVLDQGPCPSSGHTYSYDGANRLTRINGGPPTYTYFGPLRIKKVVGSTTTVYIYSGSKPIAEYVNGSLAKEYIYDGSRLLATVAGTATTYHHPDHLSNRAETDQSGTSTRTSGHFPFGEVWYEGGTPDKWKFTSYEHDSGTGETGLDYAQMRYYASGQGRFMGVDPLPGNLSAPQSLNHYSYAANDPINLADPSGALITSVCLLDDNGDNVPGTCIGGGFVDGQFVLATGSFWQAAGEFGWNCSQVDCSALNQVGETFKGANGQTYTVDWGEDGDLAYFHVFDDGSEEELSAADAEELGFGELSQMPSNIMPWDTHLRDLVIAVLRGKNDCSDWFKKGKGSAPDVMSNVRILLVHNTDKPPVLNPADASTYEDPMSPIEVDRWGRFYSDSNNGILVGGVYPAGSLGARMVIMLHELAHQIQPPGFTHDGRLTDPADASEKNTTRVMEHCAKAIDATTW